MAEIPFGELFYLNILGTPVSGQAIVESINTNFGGLAEGIYHDISIRCYQRDYVEAPSESIPEKAIIKPTIRKIRS